MRFINYGVIFLWCEFAATQVFAQAGFVNLPKHGNAESAYVLCNPTGNFGLSVSEAPKTDSNNTCSISTPKLLESATNSPLEGFRFVGVMVSDIEVPKSQAGERPDLAVLTDAIWRNKENTECILGTHLQMKNSPLANGQYWEVNDIARAGFAQGEVGIAYFYKLAAPEIGGGTEVLFRAGRTFTSVKAAADKQLPSIKDAPPPNVAISESNAAAYSANWVTFTTDLSFKDDDGTTQPNSSIFYIKYACDARDPVSKPGAISFRTMGQNGKTMEISAPALVPVDAQVDQY
jgi:hypothetical protein